VVLHSSIPLLSKRFGIWSQKASKCAHLQLVKVGLDHAGRQQQLSAEQQLQVTCQAFCQMGDGVRSPPVPLHLIILWLCSCTSRVIVPTLGHC
jgi:hypothetical protein